MRKYSSTHHLTRIYWCFLYARHYARVRDLLVRKIDTVPAFLVLLPGSSRWRYKLANLNYNTWLAHCLCSLYRSILASGLFPAAGSWLSYPRLHGYLLSSKSRWKREGSRFVLPLASMSQSHQAQLPLWRLFFFPRQTRLFLPIGVWHCPSLFPKDKHIGTQSNNPGPVTQKMELLWASLHNFTLEMPCF